MSALLDDIISAAVDGKASLPDILRRCLLLGHQLKNDRLKEWANHELNGYRTREETPEYRHVQVIAKGHFFGNYGGELKNYPIPPAVLEEDHRFWAREAWLVHGVATYEGILKASDASISFPWPGDLVLYYQQKFIDGYALVSAWSTVSKNTIVDVLDTIRNKTLNMALQIKDELGTSYTDLGKIESKEKEANIQSIVFQNTGGTTNVALGQASVDASGQVQVVINQGDRRALDEILVRAGLDAPALQKLTEAMQQDGKKRLGPRISEWIKTNAGRVLSGGVKVGVGIGQQLLTEWLKQHYGIH